MNDDLPNQRSARTSLKYEGEERRQRPWFEFVAWNRHLPITLKNILGFATLATFVISCSAWVAGRWIWPWPTKADVQMVARKSDRNFVELVKNDSLLDLRISYLERVAELAAYRTCLSLRADRTQQGRDDYPPNCDDIILNVRTPNSRR